MTTSRRSTELLSLGRRSNAEWLQATPGERFTIRTSVKETDGNFTVLEVVADPRNGVPMHIHANEDEHFIVLDGTLHIAKTLQTGPTRRS
jgi:quercetin dioxygenase-like cupin family protein